MLRIVLSIKIQSFPLFFCVLLLWSLNNQDWTMTMTTTSVSALGSSAAPTKTMHATASTHLVILVHGWQGNDKELGYLQETMERQEAETIAATEEEAASADFPHETENRNQQHHSTTAAGSSSSSRIVFHSAKCNLQNTSDGIAPGGNRLVQEIEEQIQALQISNTKDGTASHTNTNHQQQQQNEHIIWLSFIGNSLGGLYARYAIAHFDWTRTRTSSVSIDDNTKVGVPAAAAVTAAVVKPMLFVTIATPHLGVGNRNTYIPLPRRMERMVGNVLGATGQDLFGNTNIVHDMGTQDFYLHPLQQFQKRIAVTNAFGTDFQVPTTTGAFLSSTSSYPHKTNLLTPSQTKEYYLSLETEPNQEHNCHDVSECLDRLGWTKIFLDVRKDIPLPAIPLSLSFFTTKKATASANTNNNDNDITSIPSTKSIWKSYELIPFLSQYGNQWKLPLGHMVSCANSRDGFNRWLNANGQSKMDQLGHDILEYSKMYITTKSMETTNTSTSTTTSTTPTTTPIQEETTTMMDQSNGECITNSETV